MNRFDQYAAYVQWGLVAFVAIFALLYALRASKPHFVRPPVQIISGLLPFAGAYFVMTYGGFAVVPLYAAAAVAVGAVPGVLLGRRVRMGTNQGRAVVRPSRLIVWFAALSWILVAVAIMFVGVDAASAAMLLALLFSGMGLAESMCHIVRARGAVRPAA